MFYDEFVALCNSKGVSRTKACIDCDVSRTAWHKWENGATPNGATLSKFAEYFGVTVDRVLGTVVDRPLTLEQAKQRLSQMVNEDPSMPSAKRLEFLFSATDYDRTIVAFNLDIDQTCIDCWLQHAEVPPSPIVDKILGVFQIKADELLSAEELSAYRENADDYGVQKEKAPAENGERSMSDSELKFALFGDCDDVTDDDLADVRRYAAFVLERKKDLKK